MAIAPGWYGLTIEKFFIDTLGDSMEAEDGQLALCTNTHTPDFNLDDFFDDIDNEVTGTGYTSGGVAVTTTEITISAGILTYDAVDTVFSTVTISNAEGGPITRWTGVAATSELILFTDFGSAASATAADFTVQWAAGGIGTVDFIP